MLHQEEIKKKVEDEKIRKILIKQELDKQVREKKARKAEEIREN